MAVPDPDFMSELIPLLVQADRLTGQWIKFQVDRDEELAKTIRWMVVNAGSPFTKRDGRRDRNMYVIEWQRPDGTWTTKGSETPRRNPAGERYGRIRFRKQQTNPTRRYS